MILPLAFCLALVSAAPEADNQNLIHNGRFEVVDA
jgi:hypothetical protein